MRPDWPESTGRARSCSRSKSPIFGRIPPAAERTGDPGFIAFVTANYEPTDLLFRLAEQTGVVLLNGGGFEGPEWSIRVSLANLRDVQYEEIGKAMMRVGQQYLDEYEASKA
jgi:aspartate 4-decarboxylase